jgi:hypothetical protein
MFLVAVAVGALFPCLFLVAAGHLFVLLAVSPLVSFEQR